MTTATAVRDSALSRVERHASPEWIAAANKAVRSCARILHEITTDDVWGALDWMNAYTQKDNMIDMVRKGRQHKQRRTACA